MIRTLAASAAVLALLPATAYAAETVNFTMQASMPSLRDAALKDTFTVGLADKQVETTLKITCQAAQGGIISGQNESCAVTGNGALINPNNGQKLQRTQYAGGWVVKSDGFTDGATMAVNYLAVGKVPATNGRFAGTLMLKPENPSTAASLLRDTILKKIKVSESGLIDERVDTVQFNNFTVPSAGLPSDKGCVWNGDMVYSYQTESWFIEITAKCGGKEYPLKGNMPFTSTPNVGNQNQYDLTLTLPSDDAVGGVGRHHDDRHEAQRIHLGRANRPEQRQARHARQPKVGDHEVGRLARHRLQRLRAVVEQADTTGLQRRQHGAQDHLHRLGILDHDDVEELDRHGVAGVCTHGRPGSGHSADRLGGGPRAKGCEPRRAALTIRKGDPPDSGGSSARRIVRHLARCGPDTTYSDSASPAYQTLTVRVDST